MKQQITLQGFLSIAGLVCLAIGWIQPFSPALNDIFYNQLFYVFIGSSFFFQAKTFFDKKFRILMYIAAACCVVGAVIPPGLGVEFLKTIGLFGGVILSFVGRQSQPRN